MTIPLWILIPLALCALLGIAAVLVTLAVLAAAGASHRPDRIAPLLDVGDESGLLIEGPWHPARDVEGGR